MGLYDAEVIKHLGREAYDYIVDRVKCGVISGQQMKDIAYELHPHILGNHLRRLESGKGSDEAEFRRILSDWFNQELYGLQQKTALSRLISILKGPSVSLPAEGKRLKQISEGIEPANNQSGSCGLSIVLGSSLNLNVDVSVVKNYFITEMTEPFCRILCLAVRKGANMSWKSCESIRLRKCNFSFNNRRRRRKR